MDVVVFSRCCFVTAGVVVVFIAAIIVLHAPSPSSLFSSLSLAAAAANVARVCSGQIDLSSPPYPVGLW